MKQNYDIVSLNSNKEHKGKVLGLVEEICDRFNLQNYFGIFSVAVDEAMNLIYDNKTLNENFKVDFSFEQCVNGVCFTFKGNQVMFTSITDIIQLLTNECNILDEGRTLELIFYVSGIDTDQLKARQERFKIYFKQKEPIENKISSENGD